MAEFELVDLTQQGEVGARGTIRGEGQSVRVGQVDTAELAAGLESLRQDLTAHIAEAGQGLQLAEVKITLALSVEGKIAFVAKGAAEASVEVLFKTGQ